MSDLSQEESYDAENEVDEYDCNEDESSLEGPHEVDMQTLDTSVPVKVPDVVDTPNKTLKEEIKKVVPDTNLPPIVAHYPKCSKGGFHDGEYLNMVCFDNKCQDNVVLCAICLEEEHKGHKVKPLKIVMEQARKYFGGMAPTNLSIDNVKSIVGGSQTELMQKFDTFQKKVAESMEGIKDVIKVSSVKMTQQVDFKINNKVMINEINQLNQDGFSAERFIILVNSLLAGVPLGEDNEDSDQQTNQEEVEQAVTNISQKLEKEFTKRLETIKLTMDKYIQLLQKTSENPPIFSSKVEFTFSETLKHSSISVGTPKTVKSTGYNYHFALMEPSLEEKGKAPQKVQFKILENNSNWIAVGVCHKNTVVQNSFNFNYSSLGHGAYMISCNGGSWSSIDSENNNVVTAFHFYKHDTVVVEFDPVHMVVKFTKKDTSETYSISFSFEEGNELHLCTLFYYANDEVEFLSSEAE